MNPYGSSNPYGQYDQSQYGQNPYDQQQQQYSQQPQQQQQPQQTSTSWLQAYQSSPYEDNLKQVFNAWDLDKSGHIDATELESAMKQLGETDITPDTVQLMIQMFDHDQSGRIDFTEFSELYSYVQEMKSAFQGADTDGTRSLNIDQVKMALGRVHGPLIAAGGAALVFGLAKMYDKKKKGNLDWPSFLKTALRFGSMRTGFEHKYQAQQPFQGATPYGGYSANPNYGSPVPGFKQQQQPQQSWGQPQQNWQQQPQQNWQQNQPSMAYGAYGTKDISNLGDQFFQFAQSFLDSRK